jgi:adenine-specific DNA-methyltransferase
MLYLRKNSLTMFGHDDIVSHMAELYDDCIAPSIEDELSSLVQSFISSNKLHIDRAMHGYYLSRILSSSVGRYSVSNVCDNSISIKDIEAYFESLIDRRKRTEEGAIYTPNYVIDYIINYSFALYQGAKIPTFVDPSCGAGGFLIRAIGYYKTKYKISANDAYGKYIYGIDINRDAITCAGILVELYCMIEGEVPPSSHTNLRCCDSLLLNACNEHMPREYDIVATNPPYVKLQNLDEDYRRLLENKYGIYASGNYSLSMLFLIMGHRLLTKHGVLGFITQNNLFTSLSGQSIREYLSEERCINTIVDFGHKKVFKSASAYTCLIFLSKIKTDNFRYAYTLEPEISLVNNNISFSTNSTKALDSKKWRLASASDLNVIRHLETCGSPLGSLADIKVGFATLKDAVFLLSNNAISELGIEDGIVAPAYKVASLSSESDLRSELQHIIRPYERLGTRWVAIDPDKMMEMYPNAYKYLKIHEEALLARDKGKKPTRFFYEWSRTQGMESIGPKLLTKTFSKEPNFILDTSDALFCNGYSVKPKIENTLFEKSIGILLLQKILNSLVMDYYAKLTSFQIEGGYQCFQKNFIEKFCIPEICDSKLIDTIISGSDEDSEFAILEAYKLKRSDILIR